MWKVLILVILALIIALAIFFGMKYFSSIKPNSSVFNKPQPLPVNNTKPPGKVLGDDTSQNQISLL